MANTPTGIAAIAAPDAPSARSRASALSSVLSQEDCFPARWIRVRSIMLLGVAGCGLAGSVFGALALARFGQLAGRGHPAGSTVHAQRRLARSALCRFTS